MSDDEEKKQRGQTALALCLYLAAEADVSLSKRILKHTDITSASWRFHAFSLIASRQ